MRYVQAAITCVSFPSDIADLHKDIADFGPDRALDLDLLTAPDPYDPDDPLTWSAPKHLVQGDILFFYHTRSALSYIRRALHDHDSAKGHTRAVLNRALEYFHSLGGSIFGCAQVAEAASFEAVGRHFDWRSQAPIRRIHTFRKPLRLDVLNAFIPQPHGNTVTPLTAPQFDRLKAELGKYNSLPSYLRSAGGRDVGLNQLTAKNWRRVVCSADIRFRYEEQLRTYFADYLLREIKDVGSPLLEECEWYRNNNSRGIADYFVKVDGHWLPVEAKINTLMEPDLLGQVTKYLGVQRIRPRRGTQASKSFPVEETQTCLVVDQAGLYLVRASGFIECAPGKPRWRRECLPQRHTLRKNCFQ